MTGKGSWCGTNAPRGRTSLIVHYSGVTVIQLSCCLETLVNISFLLYISFNPVTGQFHSIGSFYSGIFAFILTVMSWDSG